MARPALLRADAHDSTGPRLSRDSTEQPRPWGLFHLAGADRVSRWELGLKVAETFGLDAALLQRVDSSRFPGIAPRPKDTTFSTWRMQEELGVAPMTLAEGLGQMKAAMGIGV